jgi:uncharacterized glyoxalase superfamily protein PhnB
MATRKKTKTSPKAKPAAKKRAATAGKAPRAAAQSGGLSLGALSVSFTVNDLDRSLRFYRDVIGFKVTDRWERDGTLVGVELTAGKGVVMLGQDDWKKGRDRAKGEGVRLYAETTQDVDRLAAQIKAKGGALSTEPLDAPWGARMFGVDDPDGFKITIFKTTKRGR